MPDTTPAPRPTSPSAWRGIRRSGSRLSFLKRAGDEIAGHPAETAAMLAMVVAMSRLLRSRKRVSRNSDGDPAPRSRSVVPISVMAALCIIGLASCASDGGAIAVAPDPNSYGSEYAEDFTNAGRQIAEQACASCHAIGNQTRSPHPDAPPMNTLLSRYNPDTLADDLIAGIRLGHDDMPLFDFNVIAADSLIAYLESISPKKDQR